MGRTAHSVGDRIEGLLDGIPPGRSRELAEELARLLVGLYGEGLAHVVDLVGRRHPELVDELADDELVGSLLLLHDLHPVDLDTRVQRALDRVRPYLGSHAGGVTYLGVDDAGVAHLRLEGHCDGCPSSTMTVRTAIEGALRDAAPDLAGIDVAGAVAEPEPTTLLQVGMGPPAGWNPPVPASTGDWATLPDVGPPTGRVVSVPVAGTTVAVCAVRGTLYAYRDACADCGTGLDGSTLDGSVLTCAGCGARFDVRLAGAGVESAGHLDPVPLLSDSAGTRVALAQPVPS